MRPPTMLGLWYGDYIMQNTILVHWDLSNMASMQQVASLDFSDICIFQWHSINTLRLRQNGLHLPDDVFICIFLNENVKILIEI